MIESQLIWTAVITDTERTFMQIELTSADWLICCLTLGFTVVLGLYLAMRAHSGENSANFFLAGRSMIWPVIGGSLFATNIGAEHLVGLSGDCYRYGLKAGTIEVCALSLGFGAAYLFPYYLKNQIFTIPQFLELRFGVKSRLFFAGFTLFVSIVMKLALALFAGALVMKSLLGMDVMTTVFIMGAVAAAITILGGFAAVTYTDALQSIIMIVGCTVMLFIGLDQVGGWSELVNSEPAHMSIHGAYDDPNFPFWGIVAASFWAGMFYWCFDQTNVQRVLGARDLPQARWGVMLAIFLKLSVIFIVAVPGVIVFVLYPDIGDSKLTFVTLLNKLLPNGMRGLVLAALIAALISSLDSVLNSISTITVRDFGLFLNPDLSEKQQVFIGRASIIAGTLLGIAATYMVYTSEEGVYRYFQALAAIIFSVVTPGHTVWHIKSQSNYPGCACFVYLWMPGVWTLPGRRMDGCRNGQRNVPLVAHDLYRSLFVSGGVEFSCRDGRSIHRLGADPKRPTRKTGENHRRLDRKTGSFPGPERLAPAFFRPDGSHYCYLCVALVAANIAFIIKR